MRLYLIRHPPPLLAQEVCYGQSDPAVGAEHCVGIVVQLLKVLPENIKIISSPLRRCFCLAQMLAMTLNHSEPSQDDRLMELNFGRWENTAWDDIARAEIDSWAADMVAYAPGGGESVLEMAVRIAGFLTQLQREQSGDECALVCHAGTIRLIMAYQQTPVPQEMAQLAVAKRHTIDYGSCTVLELARN